MSVEIFIPVMGFSVEVLPNEGRMSLIEQAAVLFILACQNEDHKPTHLSGLSRFLQLDESTTYDLVLGLWRDDRVTINPEDGTLTLSVAVEEAINKGGSALADLGTSESPAVVKMLYDLVSGSALPETKYNTPRDTAPRRARYPRAGRRAGEPHRPYPRDLEGFRTLDTDDLATALSRHPEVTERNGRSDIFSFTVLTPDEPRTPGHVQYLGVFFDLTLDDAGLSAVPNDSRGIRTILGGRVARYIEEAYALLKDTDSDFARFLEDSADTHGAAQRSAQSPIEAFLACASDPGGSGDGEQRTRLAELWWEARSQLAQTAQKAQLAVSAASGRAGVGALLRDVVSGSEGDLIVALPPKGNAVADDTNVENTILSAFLDGTPPRRLGLQLGSDMSDRSLPSAVKLARDAGRDADRQAIVQEPTPPRQTAGLMGLQTASVTALACPLVAGSGGLVLLDGSVLAGTSTQAIALRPRDGQSAATHLGFDRIARPFGDSFVRGGDVSGRSELVTGFGNAPNEIVDLVARLDAIHEQIPDGTDIDDADLADSDGDEPADETERATHASLALSEQITLVGRLENWALFEADSAETVFGADILTWATTLLRRMPADAPVCIGLSDYSDWNPDPSFMAALRQRYHTGKGLTLVFVPPDPPESADPAKAELNLERLRQKLMQAHPRVAFRTLPTPGRGHYSLGFVAGPGFGVYARRGVARRIESFGRAAAGQVAGIRVCGRANAIKAASGLGLPEVETIVAATVARPSLQVPRLSSLFALWKAGDQTALAAEVATLEHAPSRSLPGGMPADFVRALQRAEASLEAEKPAFGGARQALADGQSRTHPAMAAGIFGLLVDPAYENPALQDMALAVATGCDLPAGLDLYAILSAPEAAPALVGRVLVATLLAQGARPDLVESVAVWRAARSAAAHEPTATLDRLIDALADLRGDILRGDLAQRVVFLSDRQEPEEAWRELGEHLLARAHSKVVPVFFCEFLFAARPGKDAPLTARLADLVQKQPDVWSVGEALQRLLPDGLTLNALADRDTARLALEVTYEPALAAWLHSPLRRNERPAERFEPYGTSLTQLQTALRVAADYLSDIAFALGDAGRCMRNERALVAATAAVKALDPPGQRTHLRALWDGLVDWLGTAQAANPRCPWTVARLIAGGDGGEDRVVAALAEDPAPDRAGLDDVMNGMVEAARFEDLRALCHALDRLDARDLKDDDRRRVQGRLLTALGQWVSDRKQATDRAFARFTQFGMTPPDRNERDKLVASARAGLAAAEAAAQWPDDQLIDDLSLVALAVDALLQGSQETLRAEADRLDLSQLHPDLRKIARLDDATPGRARLDFLKWQIRHAAALTAPKPISERKTTDWLQKLQGDPLLDGKQPRDDAAPMIDGLRHALAEGLVDEDQIADFADHLAAFLGLETAPRGIDRVATGWRLWIDGDAAMELAPHLYRKDEGGIEILFRGTALQIVEPAADAAGRAVDRTARIRLNMISGWGHANSGDRLSLGDIVPAALVGVADRRTRIARRLIARSDSFKGWWPSLRREGTDEAAEARRWRKLALLFGQSEATLRGRAVADVLTELFGFLPSEGKEERDRSLQMQIIAFQAGESLLNAVDLVFDGIMLRSDGMRPRRLLLPPDSLLHRDFPAPMVRHLLHRALPGMPEALAESGASIHELTLALSIADDHDRASVGDLAAALDGLVELSAGRTLETLLKDLLGAGWLTMAPDGRIVQREPDGLSDLVYATA